MLPAGPSPATRVVWDVSEQGQALLAVLFPHLAGLRAPGGGRRSRGDDRRVVPGGLRVLPAVRPGIGAGARRVCAHGG
jgi:hypothetical protein